VTKTKSSKFYNAVMQVKSSKPKETAKTSNQLDPLDPLNEPAQHSI
jgi:hypothetical protein